MTQTGDQIHVLAKHAVHRPFQLCSCPAGITEIRYLPAAVKRRRIGVCRRTAGFITQDVKAIEVGFQRTALTQFAAQAQPHRQTVAVLLAHPQPGSRHREYLTALLDVALPNRIAVAIAQIAVGAGAQPLATFVGDVGQHRPLLPVVAQLHFDIVSGCRHHAAIAKVQARIAQLIASPNRPADTLRRRAGIAATIEVGLWLRITFQTVVGEVVTGITDPVAVGNKGFVAIELLVNTIGLEALREVTHVHMEFFALRNRGFDQHHATHCIATILSGERAVEHFDLRYFAGRYQCPARRAVPPGLEEIMQRHPVGKDHRPRGLEHIAPANPQRAVGIADEATANHQAGLVFHQVFGGRRVDTPHIFRAKNAVGTGERRIVTAATLPPHPHLFNSGVRQRRQRGKQQQHQSGARQAISHSQFPLIRKSGEPYYSDQYLDKVANCRSHRRRPAQLCQK